MARWIIGPWFVAGAFLAAIYSIYMFIDIVGPAIENARANPLLSIIINN